MNDIQEELSRSLSTFQPEQLQWLWPGRIAAGKLTLIDGDPSLGKSLLTLDLASRLTTAKSFPDGFQPSEPKSVILLTSEDGIQDTILPRLRAAGADLERVHVFLGRSGRPPSIPEDCDLLRETICRTKAALLIADPFLAFLSTRFCSVNDQMVRQALTPLAAVAEETKSAFTMIRHLNKSAGGQRALYRGSGSIGIIGACRTAFLVGRDPDDADLRVLACTKNNLANPPPSLGFRIVDGMDGLPVIEWTGIVDRTADQLAMARPQVKGEALDQALTFLKTFLKNGPATYEMIHRQSRTLGIGDRTLKRAKDQLNVVSEQHREEGATVWYWRLPDGSNEPSLRPAPGEDHAHFMQRIFEPDPAATASGGRESPVVPVAES